VAAPNGNKFWLLRSKHGRDKLFATPELLWEAACEYFKWCDDNPWIKKEQLKKPVFDEMLGTWDIIANIPTARPYTIEGLARYWNCNRQWINDFEKALKGKDDQQSKDFSLVLTRVRETIYQQKFEGAAIGAFNASIIGRDLGLVEKKDVTSDGESLNQGYYDFLMKRRTAKKQ
jgi:hypothetical protein